MLKEPFKFNLQFNAEEESENQEGSENGSNAESNGGGENGDSGKEQTTKTYSKDEAERIASQREERARKSALKSYFEQQGYSQSEVEQMLQADKDRREKEKTDLEREKGAREIAEKAKDQAIATANSRIARTEFKIAAQAAGVPADRLEAAVKLADLSELVPDEKTGEISVDNLKSVVTATLEANPFLKGTVAPSNVGGSGSNPGGGGSNIAPSLDELGKLSMSEYFKARKTKK